MKTTQTIERYGAIIKQEPLSSVDGKILMQNTKVLEATSPFYGYYDEIPQRIKPQMVYLLLAEPYSSERIIRATIKVKKSLNLGIDAASASITLGNQTCSAIRILDLEEYKQIRPIQELYDQEGILFKAEGRTVDNEMAMIRIRCFLMLRDYGNGLYLQTNTSKIGFFELPYHIPWNLFLEATKEVKYDTDLLYFDAATAFYFYNKNIVDMVRIYRENLDVDRLIKIKERYLKVLETMGR